jgi:arylsulfatase A-like enzyme
VDRGRSAVAAPSDRPPATFDAPVDDPFEAPSGMWPFAGWLVGALFGGLEVARALAPVARTPRLVAATMGLGLAVNGLVGLLLGVIVQACARAMSSARSREPSGLARLIGWAVASALLLPGMSAAVTALASRRHGPLSSLALGAGAALFTVLGWGISTVVAGALTRRARKVPSEPPVAAGIVIATASFALLFALGLARRWPLDPRARALLLGVAGAVVAGAPWLLGPLERALGRRGSRRPWAIGLGALALAGLCFAWAIRGVEAMVPWGLAPWLSSPWCAWLSRRWLSSARPRALASVARVPSVLVLLGGLSLGVTLTASREESARKVVASGAIATQGALNALRAALDRDGDGHPRWISGGDCRDDDPEVHPGAADWPGDGIDADCDGRDDSVELPRARRFVAVPATVFARPNVLLLTVDAMRADHLGAYGYARPTSPAIDALARESVRFDRAFSNAPSTRLSMPTIATGRWPSTIEWDHAIWWPRFTARQRTLAEALHDHGYETGAVYSIEYFSRRFARGFERGVDVYDDRWTSLHTELHGAQESSGTSSREVADSAIEFVSRRRDRPWMLWAHFFDPHHQYVPHQDGQTPRFGDAPMDLYDAEIAYTDRHIGRLLARLRETGQWERTVIVLTGDHGEGFGEHGVSTHGFHLYAAQTRVPMIVRVPGIAPGGSDVAVSHVDVAPTLANLARTPEEPTFLGRSMVDALARTRAPDDGRALQEVTYDGAVRRWAIVSRAHHLLWNHTPESTRECYDLRLDPDERQDLMGSIAGAAPCGALFEELSRAAASLSLTPDYARALAFGVLAPGAPRPTPEHGTDARLGGLVRVAGWDGPAVVTRGQSITVTVHFDVLDRVTGGWDLFVHLSGRLMARNLDHPVLGGVYPVDRWQRGQRLRDRWTFTVAPDLLPGTYDLLLGLYRGNERLPVIPPESGDDQRRLRVGQLEVR